MALDFTALLNQMLDTAKNSLASKWPAVKNLATSSFKTLAHSLIDIEKMKLEGTITDEQPRNFTQQLSFLDAGKKYVAKIYRDAPGADWEKNPMAYTIESFIVDSKTVLKLNLAPGGGEAVSLMPASENDTKTLKKYKAR